MKENFSAIAVIGGHKDARPEEFGYFYPCGVCRQVMMEFCKPDDFRIITARSENDFKVQKLKDLLPDGFGPSDLE